VIIYDSDWNPQADLQAQDRCHRIGQTKQVHVYRLVTDDTVEVKVVERAQQKLKLDAMVVQQGRLQDKDKKMTKTDLMETLKFGADKIFRTKDSTSITDEDIDIILEKGRNRTEELSEKMQIADKGDLYDFRLDGGTGAQMFEGKDYSDRAMRESGALSLGFIDTGPRERKPIVNYSEGTLVKGARPADTGEKKQPKMPRHLRLPKMEDWQFYDRERLQDLQDEEARLFDQLVERGELPPAGSISKLVLLDVESHEEKNNLLAQGFGDWNRYHYSNFVKASAKYGRTQYGKISDDVGRPVEEVTRYDQQPFTYVLLLLAVLIAHVRQIRFCFLGEGAPGASNHRVGKSYQTSGKGLNLLLPTLLSFCNAHYIAGRKKVRRDRSTNRCHISISVYVSRPLGRAHFSSYRWTRKAVQCCRRSISPLFDSLAWVCRIFFQIFHRLYNMLQVWELGSCSQLD
jgi:hypothetical protein